MSRGKGDGGGDFAARMLDWSGRHGRKDLPWQNPRDPYRVWVSEIMLQQTQVRTVVDYFERFMARYPDVIGLADAPLDDVLYLWSGLGYYARARNLHRSAVLVRDEHGGEMPDDLATLVSLPGIGRSTAGAVLALSRDERHPILDGNVKRVLCRYHGINDWPGRSEVQRELWTLAEQHTPNERVADYTQAIMDLGATVCTRTAPRCGACPLAIECVANVEDRQGELPARRARPALPHRETVFVIARNADGEVMLEQRPPAGIWGGLWSFPECARDDDVSAFCTDRLGYDARHLTRLPPVKHGFTHYRLTIHPVLADVQPATKPRGMVEERQSLWYNPCSPARIGLAAPVSELLGKLKGR